MSKYKNKRNSKSREVLSIEESIASEQQDSVGIDHVLFSQGYSLDLNGNCEQADALYLDTIHLLEELSSNSESPVDILDVAEIALQHGRQLFKLERFSKAKLAFGRAVEIFDSLALLDASTKGMSKLALSVTWYARALRKSKRIDRCIPQYQRAIGLHRTLGNLTNCPQERLEHRLLLGSNLLGLSKALKASGEIDLSKLIAEESYDILGVVMGRTPLY